MQQPQGNMGMRQFYGHQEVKNKIVNTIGDKSSKANGRRVGFNEFGEPMTLQEQLNALTSGKPVQPGRELPAATGPQPQTLPASVIAPDPSKV